MMPESEFSIADAVRNSVWSALSHFTRFNLVHPFKVAARVRIPLGVLWKFGQSSLSIRTFVLPGATASNHEQPRNTSVSSPVNAQLMPKT